MPKGIGYGKNARKKAAGASVNSGAGRIPDSAVGNISTHRLVRVTGAESVEIWANKRAAQQILAGSSKAQQTQQAISGASIMTNYNRERDPRTG